MSRIRRVIPSERIRTIFIFAYVAEVISWAKFRLEWPSGFRLVNSQLDLFHIQGSEVFLNSA